MQPINGIKTIATTTNVTGSRPYCCTKLYCVGVTSHNIKGKAINAHIKTQLIMFSILNKLSPP